MVTNSKRLALTTLLGAIAFISKGFLPTPVDKMFIVVQALAFALASLLIRGGATYASVVNGALLSIIKAEFFPFSIFFSILYGLLIDGLFFISKVKTENCVRNGRLLSALSLSTAIIGFMSIYVATSVGLMPLTSILYVIIFVIGVINGIVAGYLTSLIWNKYLAYYFKN
ncbi:hypothetical protein HXY33_00140 [Candidatus Bathyarchaeota archaeon]|nr:hypothetical protein [Candidatus Bathyarchaeota archaeon]